jgi:hypothetical protein
MRSASLTCSPSFPDFWAELVEHATNGDIMFLRWVATVSEVPMRARGLRRSEGLGRFPCAGI